MKVPTLEEAYCGRFTGSNNVLAAIETEGKGREVDPKGKSLWKFTGLADVFEALRLSAPEP